MHKLVQEKNKAITLRKRGYSYNDILKIVLVSKSTLSNWLKGLPLTADEKHLLKDRVDKNISLGRIRSGAVLSSRRMKREKVIFDQSKKEFGFFVKDPFFQVGLALYWAEGSKGSNYWGFTNSDPDMIRLMIKWIEKFFSIERDSIGFRLYTHKPFADEDFEAYWSQQTGKPVEDFKKTVYKSTGLMVKKRANYKGCLRIHLGKVSYFRKMIFWQKMLTGYYKITNAPVAQRIERFASDEEVPGSSPGGRTSLKDYDCS